MPGICAKGGGKEMSKSYSVIEKCKEDINDLCKDCTKGKEIKKCIDNLIVELEQEIKEITKLFSRAKAINIRQQAEIDKLKGGK